MAISFRQTGCLLEYSEDNGVSWHFVADLSRCSQSAPPVVRGDDLRCSIAAFLTSNLQQMQNEIISGKQVNASDVAVAGNIVGFLGAAGAFVTGGFSLLITAAAGAALRLIGSAAGLDLTNFSNALNTTGFYQYVKCRLYCILPSDGTFGGAVLEEWVGEISAFDVNNPVYRVVSNYVAQLSLSTWQQLASLAIARLYPGDCSLCECAPRCQPYMGSYPNRTPVSQNADGTYTITGQLIPGTSLYIGGFSLYYPTYSCKLTTVEAVESFTYPTAPVSFAAIIRSEQSGTKQFVSPQTLSDLVGECCYGLILQSTEDFEIKVGVTPCDTTEWCYTFDFTGNDDGEWVATSGESDYSPGVGWISNSPDADRIYIQRAISITTQITEITFTISTPMSGYGNNGGWYANNQGSILQSGVQYVTDLNATSKTFTFTGVDTTVVGIAVESDSTGNPPTYPGAISSVTLRGTGANPFGSNNCV